jgi:hypothetical protein
VKNLHPGWVIGGWLVAFAVTALVFLGLTGLGLDPEGVVAPSIALTLGFFAGGLFVGVRWSNAPVLNGTAMALVSVIVWLGGRLLAPDAIGDPPRELGFALVLVVQQLVAAVAGALAGRALVRTGHVPDPATLPPEA